MDEFTQMKFSYHYKHKDDIMGAAPKLLRKLENVAGDIKYLRQDNAGENKALEAKMKSSEWKFKTNYEYTAPNTPQQNSLAEVSFRYLSGCGRAIANDAHLPKKYRFVLANDLLDHATKLDWLVPVELNGEKKARVLHYQKTLPKFTNFMKLWGEAGVVTT